MDCSKDEIKRLEKHITKLQEAVGRWRRMAQGKAPQPNFLKERHDHDTHFIDIVISDIPEDTPLHEAQLHIRDNVIPYYQPYQYHACYRTKKYGWVATLSKVDFEINMREQLKKAAGQAESL